MNVTILEDRPLMMREAIVKMESIGIHTKRIICYKNEFNSDDKSQNDIKSMCDTLHVDLSYVDYLTFDSVLDEFYGDKEMVFLFDMDMYNDFSHHFLQRINVIYALKKREVEGNDGRIWFYTTGPISAIEQINEYFPNRQIPVLDIKAKESIAILDYEFLQEMLLG